METTKTKWVLDIPHSEIGFKVKHMLITNISGVFTECDTRVFTSGNDFLTAGIDFWMNPASIDTGDEKRDAHLRSPDFFDIENFPKVTFNATSKIEVDNENFLLYGDLTIRGITKSIKLNVEFGGIRKDPWGVEKAGFSLSGKINRKDWGLNWNAALEAGGLLVSEEVRILCEIELIKQPVEEIK